MIEIDPVLADAVQAGPFMRDVSLPIFVYLDPHVDLWKGISVQVTDAELLRMRAIDPSIVSPLHPEWITPFGAVRTQKDMRLITAMASSGIGK